MDKKAIIKWVMPAIGVVALVAFLVLCSEPAPGYEPGVLRFMTPKVIAMAVIAGCVWAINKIDKE